MTRRREIRTDASDEDWQAFLREVEERCRAADGAAERDAPRADRGWPTENGDPVDPEVFFRFFTGIE